MGTLDTNAHVSQYNSLMLKEINMAGIFYASGVPPIKMNTGFTIHLENTATAKLSEKEAKPSQKKICNSNNVIQAQCLCKIKESFRELLPHTLSLKIGLPILK